MNPVQLMRGMTAEDLAGKRFIRLHYSADEEKTKAWAEEKRAAEADPRNWDKQMEMRRVVTDGIPVFARYNDAKHCPKYTYGDYLEPIKDSLYFMGWDAGQTLSPACLLRELTPDLMVRDLLEVVSISGESMEEFAPRVQGDLEQHYPSILNSIRHHGDATIVTRSGPNKVTAQQVAARYGFDIKAETNDWSKRKSAVDFILNLGLPDNPQYVVSAKGCPILRRGYQGMYKYKLGAQGDTQGAGVIVMQPYKNAYSHIQDAGQYCAMPIFDILKPKKTGKGSFRSKGGYV